MEIKAENTFTVTKELFYEGSRKVALADLGPLAAKSLITLGVFWAVLTGITLIMNGGLLMPLLELVIIVAIAAWMLLITPARRSKNGWKKLQNRCRGNLTRTTRFYEDRLEVESGGGELVVNYEDIRRTVESRNLLVLINADKVGIMLALKGFTKGDKETVLKLLEEWKL